MSQETPAAFPQLGFERRLQLTRPALPGNHLLRIILGGLDRIECVAHCAPEVIEDAGTALASDLTFMRFPEPMALYTVARNEGAHPAQIAEGGVVVAVVPAGESKRLPLRGSLSIYAQGIGGSTAVVIATAKRCACGAPESYDGGADPIGAFLL